MASEKRVTVIIDGEEHVSKVAEQATGGLELFGKKIPFVLDVAGLLQKGLELLASAIGTVKEFAMDSIRAYDEYATSQQRLAAQSKLTGVSVKDLKEAAKTAREEFGLGVAVANDAAITTAKYASRAGDATKQNELLAAALNLGAASGLTAAQSMEALEQGLRGQDEGFDKLLGKNPSGIWKDYADANGLAVGKMTDAQKRMAELTAVIDAGNKVGNVYNDRLQTGAGQQELMNNKLENAKIAFGAAIQPIRVFIVQGLSWLIEISTPVVVGLGKIATFVSEVFVGSFHLARSAVGTLIEGVGKLTGSKSLEEWGRKQSQAFPEFIDQLKKMERQLDDTSTAATQHGKAHELAAVKIEATGEKALTASEKAKRAADEYFDKASAKLGKPLADVIAITTTAIDDLAAAGRDQLEPMKAEQFAKHMGVLRAEADKGNAALMTLGQHTEDASASTKKIAVDTAGIARAAIDAADAFGVIDAKTASALNSVVSMATSIARLVAGDVSSIPGIIASAVNIISTMIGGDAARKRLIAENTQSMDRLRREVGNLSLNVSGETFAKVQDALGSVVNQIKGGRGAKNESDVLNALLSRGLTMGDLTKVASELGIRIRSDSGALSVDGLKQLFESMGLVELGQFGKDFSSQLEATTRGFDVNKTSDVGQIAALGRLGGQFSTVLSGVVNTNDLAGTRSRLSALFERLNTTGLSAAELGGLTGSEFLDLITNLISRIDSLSGSGAGVVTAGDLSMPTSTVTSTSSAAAASVAEILTSHTDLQTRIADATEGSYAELKMVNAKLDTLITVTAGNTDRVDAALEQERFALAVQQGYGVVY